MGCGAGVVTQLMNCDRQTIRRLPPETHARTHARTHAHMDAHTHACAHEHAREHTHARTHAHAPTHACPHNCKYTSAHASAYAPHTRARAHARANARAHTRTHTHLCGTSPATAFTTFGGKLTLTRSTACLASYNRYQALCGEQGLRPVRTHATRFRGARVHCPQRTSGDGNGTGMTCNLNCVQTASSLPLLWHWRCWTVGHHATGITLRGRVQPVTL